MTLAKNKESCGKLPDSIGIAEENDWNQDFSMLKSCLYLFLTFLVSLYGVGISCSLSYHLKKKRKLIVGWLIIFTIFVVVSFQLYGYLSELKTEIDGVRHNLYEGVVRQKCLRDMPIVGMTRKFDEFSFLYGGYWLVWIAHKIVLLGFPTVSISLIYLYNRPH